MDKRIAIGDKIDLEVIDIRIAADPDKRRVVYATQVLDESKEGEVLASMPIQEGKIIPLSVEQKFYATFYTNHGLLRCEVEVTGRYKKGVLFLVELTQNTPLEKVQRREFFRYSCHMPITYRIVNSEEKVMISERIPYNLEETDVEWKNGILLDLSGGGVRFVSPHREEKDSFLQVRLELECNGKIEIIYAYATLLRSEQSANNKSIYDNRIMFWKMEDIVREKIIRFTFEEQRKMRSKEMGK